MMCKYSHVPRLVLVQDVLPNVDNDMQVYACLHGMQKTGRAGRDGSLPLASLFPNGLRPEGHAT